MNTLRVIRRLTSRNDAFYALLNKELNADLKDILAKKIPAARAAVSELRKQHGDDIIDSVKLNDIFDGLHSCKLLLCETSHLDPHEGIRFRDLTTHEVQKLLPKIDGGQQPLPEGIFWLLLTGEVPTEEQVKALSGNLAERAVVPNFVTRLINNMPKTLHPLTQLSCAIGALSHESQFAKEYASGMLKVRHWEYIYEDALNLLAKIPTIAAVIYRHTYKDGIRDMDIDLSKDWTANFTSMLGFNNYDFTELMRLYLTIHADHEGGNVSAHTALLVASGLTDPYQAWGAGLQGLSGPLHGLACQEVIIWLNQLMNEIGSQPKERQIKDFVTKTLESDKVIPGFGHSILRITDPRYVCLRKFALKHLPFDPMFKIVSQLYTVVPQILEELGKVKNPWPNVDAHSGILLKHYGMEEIKYYPVLFGISRTIGVMASLIWRSALNLPIERPKSTTTEKLMKSVNFRLPSSYYQTLQQQAQKLNQMQEPIY